MEVLNYSYVIKRGLHDGNEQVDQFNFKEVAA